MKIVFFSFTKRSQLLETVAINHDVDPVYRYQGELLNLALDVGYRLLPAFNSTTGKVFSQYGFPSLIEGLSKSKSANSKTSHLVV